MIAAEDIALMTGTHASNDGDLVKRCIEGDQEAWKELVIDYEGLIFSIAIRICPDSEAAADILQQVCLELYQRLHEVRNAANLPGWIVMMTRRKSYEHWRARVPTEVLDDSSVDSEDVFASIERQHTLERAVASLPERNRRLIQMMYMSGQRYTYEEIADGLGIPVASIGPTRIRSLQKLRKLLT